MSSTLQPRTLSNLRTPQHSRPAGLPPVIGETKSELDIRDYLGGEALPPAAPSPQLSVSGSGGTEIDIVSFGRQTNFTARFVKGKQKPIFELALNIPNALQVDVDTIEEIVPSGAEARVFQVYSFKFNKRVVAKRFEGAHHLARRHADRESENLSMLQGHPYIIRLLDVVHFGDFSFVVLEHGGRNLRKWREDDPKQASEETIRLMAMRGLLILKYLQDEGWCHGDLKLENMLADEDGNLRLIDLGLSRRIGNGKDLYEELTTNMGTPGRQPPEQLMHGVLTLQSDTFNFGVILATLFTGESYKLDFGDRSDKRAKLRLFNKWRDVVNADLANLKISRAATHFIASMITMSPRNRSTIEQLLQHPWMHGIQELEASIQVTSA